MSDFVFNIGSIQEPFSSSSELLALVVDTLKGMIFLESQLPRAPQFRCGVSPWEIFIEVANKKVNLGEFIAEQGAGEHRDESGYFLAMSMMSPEYDGVDESLIEQYLDIGEIAEAVVSLEEQQLLNGAFDEACLCALAEFFLISICRNDSFDRSVLKFTIRQQLYVCDHLSKEAHAEEILERYNEVVFKGLNLKNFWIEKDRLFPHLLFGIDVRTQIEVFDTTALALLFKRLGSLNVASQEWSRSKAGFPENLVKIKPESRQTMDKYTSNRTFKDVEGESRIFEEHLWIDSGNRVHIFRHFDKFTIEIGYVGVHLPTMRY